MEKALPFVATNVASDSGASPDDLRDRPSHIGALQMLSPQAIKGFKGHHQNLESGLSAFSCHGFPHRVLKMVVWGGAESSVMEIPINLPPLQNFSQVRK